MKIHPLAFELAPGVKLGEGRFVLIAGPCVVESRDLVFDTAGRLMEIASSLNIPFVFKASYDKANRTRHDSFRSIGTEEALSILQDVRAELKVPVLTDVHDTSQTWEAAECVDALQIPAFLCRQTDLLTACGETGLAVNIKKGPFMAPEDMRNAVDKVRETGNTKIALTERGTTFGYHNLVVDMRGLVTMRKYAPVIFDVTHSVQQPSGRGGSSGGQREFGPVLARAAAAVGVDGFFIETHPNPDQALSDGPNMIPLAEMQPLLETLLEIEAVTNDEHLA